MQATKRQMLLKHLRRMLPCYQDSLNSLKSTTDSLSLLQDSLQTDSVSIDSIKPEKKDAIDAPVFYECTDSMVWSRNGNAYLYGAGKVRYDKIELTANAIVKMMHEEQIGK